MSSPPVHNAFRATDYVNQGDESQRIVDYFCVVGLPTKLTQPVAPETKIDAEQRDGLIEAKGEEGLEANDNQPLYYYPEGGEKRSLSSLDPIVELVVLNKTLNEVSCPYRHFLSVGM
jgi:hypothetical protein